MDVEFTDESLERLERDTRYLGGFSLAIVRSYRKKMWFIRQAMDERDFYNSKGLHFEKLKGDRAHQRSMKLNDQWRLVLELIGNPEKTAKIIEIEDYH